MRKLLLFCLVSLLVGCGMSESEKQQIIADEEKRVNGVAAVTCSIMGETRNMDSAVRVREINSARTEIGEEPYLGGDEGIKEAIKYGLCQKLVKNDLTYSESLFEMKELEREALAAQEQRKRDREEREAKEKEERERIPRQNWREAMVSNLKGASPYFESAEYDPRGSTLRVSYYCYDFNGYERDLVVVLKDGLGTLKQYDFGTCNPEHLISLRSGNERLKTALSGMDNPIELIEEIYVLIKGVYEIPLAVEDRQYDPREHPPLNRGSRLKDPIRINVKI